MHFPSVLATALGVFAPVLAAPMLSEMPTSAKNGAMLAKRDTCANYRFMVLALDTNSDLPQAPVPKKRKCP